MASVRQILLLSLGVAAGCETVTIVKPEPEVKKVDGIAKDVSRVFNSLVDRSNKKRIAGYSLVIEGSVYQISPHTMLDGGARLNVYVSDYETGRPLFTFSDFDPLDGVIDQASEFHHKGGGRYSPEPLDNPERFNGAYRRLIKSILSSNWDRTA